MEGKGVDSLCVNDVGHTGSLYQLDAFDTQSFLFTIRLLQSEPRGVVRRATRGDGE
jgi:hypothetical protein